MLRISLGTGYSYPLYKVGITTVAAIMDTITDRLHQVAERLLRLRKDQDTIKLPVREATRLPKMPPPSPGDKCDMDNNCFLWNKDRSR